MSNNTYWGSATDRLELVDEYSDNFGTPLREGCLGLVLVSEPVVIEGTRDELKTFAHRILELLDKP